MDSIPPEPELTRLLAAIGDRDAVWSELLPHVYDELRGVARQVMVGRVATLEPTGLVHEAWDRLRRRDGFDSREHFLAVAAVAMRGILVDRARAAQAAKRGGKAERVTLHSRFPVADTNSIDLLDFHAALEALAQLDERQARVVELRTFGGLTIAEIASLLKVGTSTIDMDWRTGRAWVRAQLLGDGA